MRYYVENLKRILKGDQGKGVTYDFLFKKCIPFPSISP